MLETTAVENQWSKYAVTSKQILVERDREAAQLNAFLKEFGHRRWSLRLC